MRNLIVWFVCGSCTVQTLMYTGIELSSPTVSSAMVDLVPAFTFILAIVSRCVLPPLLAFGLVCFS